MRRVSLIAPLHLRYPNVTEGDILASLTFGAASLPSSHDLRTDKQRSSPGVNKQSIASRKGVNQCFVYKDRYHQGRLGLYLQHLN
jgi:hypothetical protein